MIKVTLPDGSVKEYKKGITPAEIALSISEGLARNVISASFDGKTIETVTPLQTDGNLVLYTWENPEGKKAFWHSSAHILAQALEELYPNIKLTIGPAIANGFYYDVDFNGNTITDKDFPAIEAKMLEIAREKHLFKMRPVSKEEALSYYKDKNQYKTELIEALEDGTITFCDHSTFTDLCRGGHLPHTGFVKAVKILSVAGAYWRGNENNPQLTRVYGISFPKQKDLTEYLTLLEEAKKRDHRKLGKELELFTFSNKVGQGLPLWLPKGAALRERLEAFLRKAQKQAGYEQVVTPHIGHKNLYVTVYRYEQSGELHGLTRVRCFTQDDAHIFCTPEQLDEEFKHVIDLVLYVFGSLGFDNFTAQVSLRDPENLSKYIGTDENWAKAENAIINAAKEKNLTYVIETGEAAFYGPKLDFMVKDALGRSWQLGTIQVDYNLPERFDLWYKGADNEMHRPVMIHRAPFGSMERFVAILLEHTAGNLPLWLVPEQVNILSISEKYEQYAQKVASVLQEADIRPAIDNRNETIGKKIREAETQKYPYMVIVGEEEEKNQTVSVRKHGGESLGTMSIADFVLLLQEEINKNIRPFSN